ncbi:aldose 1-epimerase family protein [Phlyctema vagabunda]|uniref:Glucose-6-phosphate 1-epimerase n=1 Tax=Phlyctema vagabunda TaxID=108571 RepID=A0ABR4PVT3_9HELO
MKIASLLNLGLFLASARAGVLKSRTATVTEENNIVSASLPGGDSVQVYLHGATVTSWKASNGEEQLFLSTASPLDGSAAIRGGIPVVFPVFATPPQNHSTTGLPSHGWARNSTWTFAGSREIDDAGSLELQFKINSTTLIKKYTDIWPYTVSLTYFVTLSTNSLASHIRVENTGNQTFDFQFLLHTYLSVPNINTTTVNGLEGASYIDKTKANALTLETSNAVSIVNETDRIYTPLTVDTPIVVQDNGAPRITVTRDLLPDVTVWNIWSTKIQTSKDFAPKDAWQRYLAIEPGYVASFTDIEAGGVWEAGATFEAHV